jgi:hypothetical protein
VGMGLNFRIVPIPLPTSPLKGEEPHGLIWWGRTNRSNA